MMGNLSRNSERDDIFRQKFTIVIEVSDENIGLPCKGFYNDLVQLGRAHIFGAILKHDQAGLSCRKSNSRYAFMCTVLGEANIR